MRRSIASRLTAQAVEHGLVAREADQRDGRRTLLALTEAGRSHLAKAHHSRQKAFASAMAGWPADDQETFARLLTAFTAAMGAATRPDQFD